MRKSRCVALAIFSVIAVTVVPLTTTGISAGAVRSRMTTPIGTQLAELKGFGTAPDDSFGYSVAISGTTAVVGENEHANRAGRVDVFTKMAGFWTQTAELEGSDTEAFDDFGESVAISGSTIVVGANGHANKAGRAYVFADTAAGWKQVAELKGADTVAGDNFGGSVAISGSIAIVGADNHFGGGRAYVFTKMASVWKQVAELKKSDAIAGGQFGYSVAISGSTAIVGANGWAYVFAKTAVGWKKAAMLEGSDTAIGDAFGASVAISGTTAIVGAFAHANDAGRAYVFTKTVTGWNQAAELEGFESVVGDAFGFSVAISGTTAIISAIGHASRAGRVDIFTKTAGVWKRTAELKASDVVPRNEFGWSVAISGTTTVVGRYDGAYVFTKKAAVWDQAELTCVPDSDFGGSVAISGTTAIVGSQNFPTDAGSAYVFTKTAAGWDWVTELEGPDNVADDGFGVSVAISGTTAVVGAWSASNSSGSAYVFTETAGVWKQTAELEGSDTAADDAFGYAVAISGSTIIVGAPGNTRGDGRAYVFTETADRWHQTAELKGTPSKAELQAVAYAVEDNYGAFGWSVAISGTTAIVGAPGNGGSCRSYVFIRTSSGWKQVAEFEGYTNSNDDFGGSVAVSGSTVIVGAPGNGGSCRSYVFIRTSSGWKQVAELKGSDTAIGDDFGESVAISGSTIVVGANGHANKAGRAYVFADTAAGWKQVAELKGADTVAGDWFGSSLAISGTTAIVGAENHANTGRVYVFEA
jgi:hypothetical protein